MSSANKKGDYYQIRDQYYYIEIAMYNQIEGQTPLYVPFFYVDSLKINESLHTWITKGEIVFNSDFEIFARGAQSGDRKIKAPYIDRSDGRNRIHIKIYTVDTKNVDGNISPVEDESKFPKKYWEIDHDFVIIDIQDLPVGNAQRKKKMYIFIDERYQILKEKNLEWSSNMVKAKQLNKSARSLKDNESSIVPNEMLKEFLTIASTNNNTMPKINIGFDKNGSIDKPNIPFDKVSESDWDMGDPENKVHFYPHANSNGIDDLFFILSQCTSSDGFPVILDIGRSSEDKEWQLKSLSKIFENASKEQVERLIVEDGLTAETSTSTPPYIPRAEIGGESQIKNFTSGIASRITSYNFSPMVAIDDSRILNSPSVVWNEHTGAFKIYKKENTAKKVIEKLKELGQKGLYTFKNSSQNPQIVINLNKTKTTGQMTKYQSLVGPYSLKTAPLNQMILDSIFLNQSLSFQCPGLILRTPGKFIFVDRIGASETNPFDDRFLGQWLMVKVTHLFTQSSYDTEVVANKIDSYSSLFPEEDGNY
jgi:hypothetical protein